MRINSKDFAKIFKSTERRELNKLAHSLITGKNLDRSPATEHYCCYEAEAMQNL